ncbi:nuclear transport factor 2 family protein [Novosphingobium malaysiense]|uniref:SnoaL-like domain-containing protein n=1 Tax=Novosphingobium malaysiense TaxID=1348853 RepID=A0A0B1ZNU4_9SPHN|nr:nuclear transport factor 2 family protein [Novosphingobium malaysiense]KHK90939.1 hypothetical protein LK12_08290 [Novosphingobium malaysiense]
MPQFAAAEAGIRQLHARYAEAVWRKDLDAFGDCFADECEWRIAGNVLEGREGIVAAFAGIIDDAQRVFMTFQIPIISLEGTSRASGRTMVSEQCRWKNGRANLTLGRYFEDFVRDDDRWRFTWRLYQVLYAGPPDLSGTYYDEPDFGAPPVMPPRDAMPAPTRRPA